jgi:RimJ/RimL family protein N-acetyltransferase
MEREILLLPLFIFQIYKRRKELDMSPLKTVPKLTGKRLVLRRLKLSDAEDIYQNINSRDIVKWLSNIPYPYSMDDAVRFIRKEHYRLEKEKSHTFGITLKQKDRVIGVISLFNMDYKNRKAEIGYWLGKRYWNQGVMREAVKLILHFGFKVIKLHRIYAGLFERNTASKKVLEKSGFKLEGKLKESRFRGRKWHDELRYGILCSEYKQEK